MSRLYRIWASMKHRCSPSNKQSNRYYYSKGIRVCDDWKAFSKFEEWAIENGYADNLTIDRIDNSKGYSPDNCQWITKSENSRKAGKEKQGIWGVYKFTYYEPYKPMIFRKKELIAENLSYSEANRLQIELSKSDNKCHKFHDYKVRDIYGCSRKMNGGERNTGTYELNGRC